MKKALTMALAVAMLGIPLFSPAENTGHEEIVISDCCIPYEAAEMILADIGMRLLIPAEWINLTDRVEQPDEGVTLLLGDEEEESWLSIDIIAVDLSKSSYESLAEGLEQNGMTDVAIKLINGNKFILFTQEDAAGLYAVLPSLDGAVTFCYSQEDEEGEEMFLAILSTFEHGDFDIPEEE